MSRTHNRVTLAVTIGVIVPLFLGCANKEDKPTRPSAARPTAATAAVASGPTTGTASVSGSVSFTGTAPAMAAIDMAADPVCSHDHAAVTAEDVIVNANSTLMNVVVYVKNGLSGVYDAPSTPSTIDQVGCVYTPHVSVVQAGQMIEILNSDDTLHNVQASPTVNAGFNRAMPIKGMKIEKAFEDAEPAPVRIKCQVHPWMTAYIGVFDHPFFAVSGDDGSFAIKNLPAGSYTIGAWHERYGESTAQVTIADGQDATADFSFGS